jgi:hypothetical protein
VSITLDEALNLTRTGDVWLFRGRKVADRAIQVATNSPVNHVGMSVVIGDLPPLEPLRQHRHDRHLHDRPGHHPAPADPFIPGLRDIPRLIPVHRLIWRHWDSPAREPAAETSQVHTSSAGHSRS